MEPALQARLLRVIEDGRVRRIGEATDRRVNVRVLAATDRDVESMHDFRDDLFFRLAGVPIEAPPLSASHATLEALSAYDWPGNVRECAT